MTSISSNNVLIDKVGHITTIGINRPEKRNCVDFNTATQIKNAIAQFEEDSNSYAAVLYGTGGNFCIPLTDGATVRLQAMIGLSRALDLILTGRSLNAKEAFEWGVVNRIVACGTVISSIPALGQAINLATSLVKFPQDCLNVDRDSTYNAAYNKAYEDLLKYEQKNGRRLLISDATKGAKRFISGIGKHGKAYNLTEKDVCEWEKEFSESNKILNPKSKL
ncbi:hypothetical protein NQ314_002466 [Rhamnusium bicolor]|uniref:Enoyl-CoA hydratase n=1 Tax=Rhamnusium bicolor TaxID=1586634 RepID=A0AAV8ZRN7_9CUCU|nr:hypothetical protein NQ314_002466 [Rhamnusium bicolor]